MTTMFVTTEQQFSHKKVIYFQRNKSIHIKVNTGEMHMFPYTDWVMDSTLLEHETKYKKHSTKWYKECEFKENHQKVIGILPWLILRWNVNLLKVVL